MKSRLIAALALAAVLASCGVKNDLTLPDGKQTAKGQHDPSKPPQPIGE
jgi:predicted small lipoprotein YifL